jgi:uncharacterized membrane protein YhaH (DUF805 family)
MHILADHARIVAHRRLNAPIGGSMVRRIAYWGTTSIVALMLLFAVSYLTGSEQVVSGFAKAGYPQHLRIVLGIAKPVAAIVLLMPGFAVLKEWAYAGVTFAWIMAFISAYTSGEKVQVWILPLGLLALLIVSYLTRPSSRRVSVGSPRVGNSSSIT